jgi:hypothetical protein
MYPAYYAKTGSAPIVKNPYEASLESCIDVKCKLYPASDVTVSLASM